MYTANVFLLEIRLSELRFVLTWPLSWVNRLPSLFVFPLWKAQIWKIQNALSTNWPVATLFVKPRASQTYKSAFRNGTLGTQTRRCPVSIARTPHPHTLRLKPCVALVLVPKPYVLRGLRGHLFEMQVLFFKSFIIILIIIFWTRSGIFAWAPHLAIQSGHNHVPWYHPTISASNSTSDLSNGLL